MKKTALVLTLTALLLSTGAAYAQDATTTRTTRTTTTTSTDTSPATTETTAATINATTANTAATANTTTATTTTKGGEEIPVTGSVSTTIAMFVLGAGLLAVGAFTFGKAR
jgi:hypothetical protein